MPVLRYRKGQTYLKFDANPSLLGIPVRLKYGDPIYFDWRGWIDVEITKKLHAIPVKLDVDSYALADSAYGVAEWTELDEEDCVLGCYLEEHTVYGVLYNGKPRIVNKTYHPNPMLVQRVV